MKNFRLAGLLLLSLAPPGCFTLGTIIKLSVEHTVVELSVERAWLTPDQGIEIDIDLDSHNGEGRTLRASIARSELEAALAPADRSAVHHLPARAVHVGPDGDVATLEQIKAGIRVTRLARDAAPVTDLGALGSSAGTGLSVLELAREIEGPKGDALDFELAIARRGPGSDTAQIARFEITLEDAAGKNDRSDVVRLLLAIGADFLLYALITSIPFAIMT